MRQVPQYLLIGDGCVAHHFRHYFSLLKLHFETWHRKESLALLNQRLKKCTHVLLLISDHAIEEFITKHLKQTHALRIHFSGSLISEHSHGAHPLMSFNKNLYDLKQYQAIPFIFDHDAPDFETLLPGLPNQHIQLHKSLKAKYHALCVLSGNFSCMLWQKLFNSFKNEFNLPSSIAHPYLLQHTQNLLNDPHAALTGPLVRGDRNTIEKNLSALHLDHFQDVYKSFVDCFNQLQEKI